MYPLDNWDNLKRGYRFKEKTWYSKYHLGLDLICEKGTPIFAPYDGYVKALSGYEGGKTVWFHWNGYIIRFLHLDEFGYTGQVKKGEIIGSVGNTGSLSKGDHSHIDISRNKVDIYDINNFVNPETFNFNLMKLIREKGRREVYAVINGNNYYVGGTAFEDLLKEKLVSWEDVKEVNYKIDLHGIIK